MSQLPRCPQCGTETNSRGVCVRCELAAGFQTPVTPPVPRAAIDDLEAKFPAYAIEGLIGRGGMGVVYRGRQRRLDRPVAIKVLSPELAATPGFRERFEREARTMATLSHPGLVSIHDFGVADDTFVLVMELVDGANLRELMSEDRLSPHEALDVVGQVCDALEYAHSCGVVHRDIKPENILVDDAGRVKLVDFGLARLFGEEAPPTRLTHSHQVMGTPHYMAPEQMTRPRDVDHRADLFSLGVVFYELLTGALPVGRFRRPSEELGIDPGYDEVLLRSLESEPNERYQGAAEIQAELRSLQGEEAPGHTTRRVTHPGAGARGGVGSRSQIDIASWTEGMSTALLSGAGLAIISGGFLAFTHETREEELHVFGAIGGLGFVLPLAFWLTHRWMGTSHPQTAERRLQSQRLASRQWLVDLFGGGLSLLMNILLLTSVYYENTALLLALASGVSLMLVFGALIRASRAHRSSISAVITRFSAPVSLFRALQNAELMICAGGALTMALRWDVDSIGAVEGYNTSAGLLAGSFFVLAGILHVVLRKSFHPRILGLGSVLFGFGAFYGVMYGLMQLNFSGPGLWVAGPMSVGLMVVGLIQLFLPVRPEQTPA